MLINLLSVAFFPLGKPLKTILPVENMNKTGCELLSNGPSKN